MAWLNARFPVIIAFIIGVIPGMVLGCHGRDGYYVDQAKKQQADADPFVEVPCSECGGDGKLEGDPCIFCDESGRMEWTDGKIIKCIVCGGTHKRSGTCVCGGTGKMYLERRFLKLPNGKYKTPACKCKTPCTCDKCECR